MAYRWIVDGNNVMGSRPDGWWRDRPAAAARLVDAVSGRPWPDASGVTIVFDGRAPADSSADTTVEVLHAGAGRSADDAIVDLVAEFKRDGSESLVVTSDRALADRVRDLGAVVMSAGRFLDLLEDAG